MSGNSSSANDSLPPARFSSILHCYIHKPGSVVFAVYFITYILLLLPLCIFILHHGLQQWRQRNCSTSSVSHSDCFTYHLVVMELVGMFGSVLLLCGVHTEHPHMFLVGTVLITFTFNGQTFFHVLTCVERHLAVVHPITYLSLRNQRGIRIRNISITCVWLFSFTGLGFLLLEDHNAVNIISICFWCFCLMLISFCSLSILCVLIRPGPGEQGGGRERVDQSKLRAFYTIMSILGVLVLRFSFNVVSGVFMIDGNDNCVLVMYEVWFGLSSSLVLPLLFLHRAGKLMCWKKNN